METLPAPLSPETLLAHADWVRALARTLVTDPDRADDVAQEAWLHALESPPRDARNLRGWLSEIVRNTSRQLGRSESRRSRREQATARQEALPDTADLVAEASLQRELVGHVLELDEPYRTVVLLRFFQGLDARDIAERQGVPLAAVRTRLQRAIAMLRKRLDRGWGDRRSWCSALVALAREPVPSGVTTTVATTGVLALLNTKLALVAGSLIGAALLGYLAWPERGEPPVQSSALESKPVALQPVGVPADDPVEAAAPAPGRVALEEPVLAPPQDSRSSGAPTNPVLLVRVVRGEPAVSVPDVCVRLQRTAPFEDPSGGGATRRTDTDGVARFGDLEPGGYRVRLDRCGSVRAVQFPAETEIEVRIPPGLAVHGRVIDEQGLPGRGALVLAHDGTSLEPQLVARADAEGRFMIEDLAPYLALEADLSGHVPSLAQPVIGQPGTEVSVVLVLGPAGRRVSGIVLRPDRSPAEDALVAVLPADAAPLRDPQRPHGLAHLVRTDEAGRFGIDDIERAALRIVAGPAPGGEEAPGLALLEAGVAEAFVEVVLRRGAVLEGIVGRAPMNRPGGDEILVLAWAAEPQDDLGYLLNLLGHRRTNAGADGSYRLGGLVPGTHELQVFGGQPQNMLAKGRIPLEEGEHGRWDVEIGSGSSLSLKVVPPVPPAALGLWQAVLYRVPKKGEREIGTNRDLLAGYARVSSNGDARFSDLKGSSFELVLCSSLPDIPGGRSRIVIATRSDLWPGAQVEIALSEADLPSARVVGRALTERGEPWANAPLRIISIGEAQVSYVETTTDGQGAFSIGPMPAGRYELRVGADAGLVTRTFELARGQRLELGEISRR